jgi:hypothetical protein
VEWGLVPAPGEGCAAELPFFVGAFIFSFFAVLEIMLCYCFSPCKQGSSDTPFGSRDLSAYEDLRPGWADSMNNVSGQRKSIFACHRFCATLP